MKRPPPRSTLDRSSAASDVYKRQDYTKYFEIKNGEFVGDGATFLLSEFAKHQYILMGEYHGSHQLSLFTQAIIPPLHKSGSVSYTHLRAHETVLDLVCRLLLEKKNKSNNQDAIS